MSMDREEMPAAWQWRYVGDREWKTQSGGAKLTEVQLENERPIEERPLYATPPSPSPAGGRRCDAQSESPSFQPANVRAWMMATPFVVCPDWQHYVDHMLRALAQPSAQSKDAAQ